MTKIRKNSLVSKFLNTNRICCLIIPGLLVFFSMGAFFALQAYDAEIQETMVDMGYEAMLEFENEQYLAETKYRNKREKTVDQDEVPRDSRRGTLDYKKLFPDTPTLFGPSGGVNIPSATIIDRGKFVVSGHYVRYRETKRLFMAHKFNYGIYDNMEVGVALGEQEDLNYKDQIFNLKYSFTPADRRIVWAAGYQFHNLDYVIATETVHVLYGVMDVKINEILKVYMTLNSTSDADNVTLNFGARLIASKTPLHSTSLFLEIEQDPGNGGYKLFNAGLKYRLSEIFTIDIMRMQNYNSSDDSSALGFNLFF